MSAEVRASWLKYIVSCAKRREGSLDLVSPELRQRIRDMGMLEWVPFERFMELARAIHAAEGSDSVDFWRTAMLRAISGPVLSPLMRGGLMMFGNGAASLLARAPQVYALTARNAGHMEVDIDTAARRAVLSISRVPGPARGSDVYAALHHGDCIAALQFARTRGTIVVDTSRYLSGELRYDIAFELADRARAAPPGEG